MSAFAPALFLLATAELGGSASLEVQAGETPTPMSLSAQGFVAIQVLPELNLRVASPATDTYLAEAVRLYLRQPNLSNRSRPLFLNRLQGRHRGQHGPRFNWEARFLSTVGEVEYFALSQVLDQQAQLPNTLMLLNVDVDLEGGMRLSERLRLVEELGGLRRQPLGAGPSESSGSSGYALPSQTNGRLASRLEYAISQRQAGTLEARATHYQVSGATRLRAIAIDLEASWTYRLSEHQELQLGSGLSWAYALERPNTELPWTRLSPIASIRYISDTALFRRLTLRARTGSSLVGFLDPVLGTFVPRARLDAGVAVEADPDWQIGLSLLGVTNVSRHAMPNAPLETLLSGSMSMRYRLHQQWTIECGIRMSERGPHLAAPDFSLMRSELVGYLSVTAFTR